MPSATGISESPLFLYGLRNVAEAAALAAFGAIAAGRRGDALPAARAATRAALDRIPLGGTIVVGDEDSEEPSPLLRGTRVGALHHRADFDFAIDPAEGLSVLATGLTNALAVVAAAPRGAIQDPTPAFYMEKLVVPPAARDAVDPAWPLGQRLEALAKALGKEVAELRIFVQEKSRHRGLIAAIEAAGAVVAAYPAGDVAGAVLAATPEAGIDALMGTGGVPEALIAACAVRALGGQLWGRLDPQLLSERAAVARARLDTARWLRSEELVRSDATYFCATGITSGLLLDGVERTARHDRLQTLMITGVTGERQLLTSWRPRDTRARAA